MKRKNAAILLGTVILMIALLAVVFFAEAPYTHDVEIVIPANDQAQFAYYQEGFVFSDTVFSAVGDTITILAGQNLGDSMVVLMPMKVREENAYEPTYITPGLEVKMEVEKGAWFRVGVNEQNPTSEKVSVHLTIEGIKLR